jgi:hypothetical protein
MGFFTIGAFGRIIAHLTMGLLTAVLTDTHR